MGKGHGRSSSKKKTVCRSTGKKSKSVKPVGKNSQTLESARKECYGVINKSLATIDVEKYGRGKRRRGQTIDYQKLNEGDEDIESTPVSPKKAKHIPTRSGLTPHRQSAQKLVTETPRITPLSTVKTKKQTDEQSTNNTTTGELLIGVQGESASELTSKESLFGVPGGTPSNVTTIGSSYPTQSTGTEASSTAGVKDAF